MTTSSSNRRHEVADFVAILAGVASVGFATWGLPMRLDNSGDGVAWAWLVYAVSGALALLGVVLAQRSAAPARLALGVGGLALLAVPVLVDASVATWIANALLGGAMLLAAPFVGCFPPDLPPARPPR